MAWLTRAPLRSGILTMAWLTRPILLAGILALLTVAILTMAWRTMAWLTRASSVLVHLLRRCSLWLYLLWLLLRTVAILTTSPPFRTGRCYATRSSRRSRKARSLVITPTTSSRKARRRRPHPHPHPLTLTLTLSLTFTLTFTSTPIRHGAAAPTTAPLTPNLHPNQARRRRPYHYTRSY